MGMENHERLTRRNFVKTAAAAAAAPWVISASALGQDAPSKKTTMGLIGCGGQGRGIMGAAMSMRDVHILAVCDVNKVNARKAKRMVDKHYENRDCAQLEDYRELIARDDIDAVLIATPDHWHALICVEAAKAGKDIYCEKPVTHDLREGRIVADTAKANDIVFQVGSMQRSQRHFKQACALVRNGYLGTIHHIDVGLPDGGHALWADSYPEPPRYLDWNFYVGPAEWTPFHPKRYDWDWRWWMAFGGSQMLDWIGHHGDIAHMGMGWSETGPVKVEPIDWTFSKERNNLYDSPMSYEFMCTYADETTMRVGSRARMPELFRKQEDTGTLWHGENGQWLFVSRGGIKASSEELKNVELAEGDFQFRRQANHMRDFVECVQERREPIAPAEHGHRSASIGHLGKFACELGATIQWDPASERIVEDDALNLLLDNKLNYRGDWKLEA